MATRSEQYRAQTERDASMKNAKADKAVAAPHEPSGHVAKKATYAREENVALEDRSRKSSRKSANRAKTDTSEMHAAQMKENTPEKSYERSAAKATHVRGRGAS
jgi:hypothetical protein